MATAKQIPLRHAGVLADVSLDPYGVDKIRKRLYAKFLAAARVVDASMSQGNLCSDNSDAFMAGLQEAVCGGLYQWEREVYANGPTPTPENVAPIAKKFEKATTARVEAYVRKWQYGGGISFSRNDPTNGGDFINSLKQAMTVR